MVDAIAANLLLSAQAASPVQGAPELRRATACYFDRKAIGSTVCGSLILLLEYQVLTATTHV